MMSGSGESALGQSYPPILMMLQERCLVTIPRLAPGLRSTATKTGELTRTARVSGGTQDPVSGLARTMLLELVHISHTFYTGLRFLHLNIVA